jgi:hypothetical protein
MAAPISRLAAASESASLTVLDGVGRIGDSIGTTGTQSTTATGITLGAAPFITGTISTAEQAVAPGLTAYVAEWVAAPTQGTGLSMGIAAVAAGFTTVPAQPPGLSTETPRLLEDTLHPAARVAPARAYSAATTMADKQEAIPHVVAPALVAEARVAVVDLVAAVDLTAVAGIGSRGCDTFLRRL